MTHFIFVVMLWVWQEKCTLSIFIVFYKHTMKTSLLKMYVKFKREGFIICIHFTFSKYKKGLGDFLHIHVHVISIATIEIKQN